MCWDVLHRRTDVELSYERAAQAIDCILSEDVDKAMSRYNGKVEVS